MSIHRLLPTMEIILLILVAIALKPSFSASPESPIPSKQEQQLKNPTHPICVVGAGISGLNTATLLQQKGYNVEVFEKEPIVGGKAFTYRVPEEIQVEMCPLLFSLGHVSLLKRIHEYHLNPVAFNVAARANFDPDTGEIIPQPNLTMSQQQLLGQAIQSYNSHRLTLVQDLAYGYLNTSSDLFLPTSQWLRLRNLDALIPAFTVVMTVEGYGALDEVPALYTVQLIDEFIIRGLVLAEPGVIFTLQEGLDTLLSRMALSLNVFVGVEVINIDRSGRHPIITLSTLQRKHCSSVILAFPPLLPKLQNIIPDLTPHERFVLDQVKIHKYVSAANSIPSLNLDLYEEVAPIEGTGEVTGLIKQSLLRRQDIFSSYSWIRGEYNSIPNSIELLEMTQQLQTTLLKMSPNPETFFVYTSEYFPHVNTQSLRNGFYQAFDALQGRHQVYYATTLLSFELMEKALEMTEAFVERYFE